MIEVENLGKTYVEEPVVRDLSFFVPEGQVLGFLGPNGAGKTTVMRMLTAFLPPTTGRVVVAGVDLDQDPVGLRRHVGYLPENVPLYPELRVDEYLRFRADMEEVPRAEVRARIEDVVDRCLIGEVRRQVIGTLSKGFRQRVGLAGALIHQPSVLILDEPTVGLDPNQIIKVRELITELGRDHTVILSTHILPEVEQVCERVFIIDRGRVVADGTPDALRAKLVGNPSLAVELKGADGAAREVLQALPSVITITERGEGRFLLEHAAGSDPREAVFRLAVEKGWVLMALTPQQASLEDVFVRLTTREDELAPTSDEEVEVHDA
jgi:ABC-2 type transport system ATP-binding protein